MAGEGSSIILKCPGGTAKAFPPGILTPRTGTNPNGGEGKLDYPQIPGWHGKCVPGQDFNASNRNQKRIGCQFYVAGFGAENVDSTEFLSCRDSDGHGTHTATTAGGNHGV